MSDKRFTLDTNILVYFFDHRDPVKHRAAGIIIKAAAERDCILANQALAEFFTAVTRKLGMPAADAARRAREWMALFPSVPTSRSALDRALQEAEAGRFAFWDALLLAAVEEAGCTVAVSEDMADGATFGKIVVRAPFGPAGVSESVKALLGLDD